jgi:putative flippase GtrA
MKSPAIDSRIVVFAAVGGVGFAIDAGVLTVMMKLLGQNLYVSRLLSFSCASLATWLLNRSLTFRTATRNVDISSSEYARYVTVQIIGALINLLVFVLLVRLHPALSDIPVIPLAVGAVFGLLVNFAGTRFWVYPDRET